MQNNSDTYLPLACFSIGTAVSSEYQVLTHTLLINESINDGLSTIYIHTVRAPKQPAGYFSKIDFSCGLFSREGYFRERVIFPKPKFQVTN